MKKITRKNLENFLNKHATNDLVLDVGAGSVVGNHSYTQFFPNRKTVDIDPTREPDIIGDIHNLPFEDNSFTTIVCTEVLEHCHDPQKAISEMHRVLKPGGKIILSTRFVYPLHDVPHDYFRFTKYGLKHLFKNWEALEIYPETDTFSALGALLQRVGFQTRMHGGRFAKLWVYICAMVLDHLNWLIVEEYGNIKKSQLDDHIMTTGYFLIAYK